MLFWLNLYITIEMFTFIQRNWVTQVSVEMIVFYKFVTCDGLLFRYFSYLSLVRQTHDILIEFVHNYWNVYLYMEELSNSSPCGDDLFL